MVSSRPRVFSSCLLSLLLAKTTTESTLAVPLLMGDGSSKEMKGGRFYTVFKRTFPPFGTVFRCGIYTQSLDSRTNLTLGTLFPLQKRLCGSKSAINKTDISDHAPQRKKWGLHSKSCLALCCWMSCSSFVCRAVVCSEDRLVSVFACVGEGEWC